METTYIINTESIARYYVGSTSLHWEIGFDDIIPTIQDMQKNRRHMTLTTCWAAYIGPQKLSYLTF